MRLSDIVSYSAKSLSHRKMRSWLTILGIVIGIGSVVALLMIGEGFSAQVNEELSALGANTIFITPISMSSVSATTALSGSPPPSLGKLYDKDVDRLGRIPEITDIARLIRGRTNVQFRDTEISMTISGIEPGIFEQVSAIEVAEGRFLLDSDRRVAVVGATIAEDAFGKRNPVQVNSNLLIDGQKYRVVGILGKIGGGFGPSGQSDGIIYIPFEDAREVFSESTRPDEVMGIVLRTREGTDTSEVVERIYGEIDASHKVKPDERDYSVVDPKSIQAAVGEILGLITLFLGAIAGISLVVGGLSIASSMFTSVLERTREIGILKSVGATEQDILSIFLFESGAVGAIGGFVGAGMAVAFVAAGSYLGLPASLNMAIPAFGVAFAFAIGMVSGYLPAKKASALSPVEALRYE